MPQSLKDLLRLTLTHVRGGDPRPASADIADLTAPADRDRVSALLDRHSTLSAQTHVLSDHPWTLLWAANREAFLPFHECRFTLAAWRDPVGPAEHAAPLLFAFHDLARARGKHAILLAGSGATSDTLSARGFRSLWIGREPFFDLATWNTRGKSGEKLRLACNHVHRVGASAREAFPARDPADRDAIAGVERLWKAARRERNNDSFLRTMPMENIHLRRYFVVETPARMESFLVCAPVSRRGWYLQDLVRLPDAPRGACELVMRTAIETFQRESFAFASGGIVPFFDPDGSRAADPAAKRGGVQAVIPYFDRLFHFQGMQQFRSKFVASRLVDVYALFWPRIITPFVAWDLRTLMS